MGWNPKLVEKPVITAIARQVHKTPAQVALAWAVQRGTALLTTSTAPNRIRENFEVSTLPEAVCMRFGMESRQGSSSIRWWRPACLGLFLEADEHQLQPSVDFV
jgi:hypothetical protein